MPKPPATYSLEPDPDYLDRFSLVIGREGSNATASHSMSPDDLVELVLFLAGRMNRNPETRVIDFSV